MKCFNCNQDIPNNSKFCPNCGQKQPTEKKCPNCSTILPISVKFCSECGYNFGKGETNIESNSSVMDHTYEFEALPDRDKVYPTEIRVDAKGNGDFSTITEALIHSGNGTTIYVESGVYKEKLIINKEVKIIGNEEKKPLVKSTEGIVCVINSAASIENIEFKDSSVVPGDGKQFSKYGVIELNADAIISNCEVTDSRSAGIFIKGKAFHPFIENCSINRSNTYGIWIKGTSKAKLRKIDINESGCCNLQIEDSANPDIEYLQSNLWEINSFGARVSDAASGEFRNCKFYKGDKGFVVEGCANPTLKGCEMVKCKIGLVIKDNANGKYKKCKFNDNEEENIINTTLGNPELLDIKIIQN